MGIFVSINCIRKQLYRIILMITYILMKILEASPERYDRRIFFLTHGRLDKVYDSLTSMINKEDMVLDIGCGTGALSLRAARRGARVRGIDINPRMLEVARIRAEKANLSEHVEFLEMAAAWAFPMSVVFSLITLFFWQNTAISVFFLVWVLSLLIFACFPLYLPLLKPGKRENAPKLLGFKRFVLIILLFTAVLTALIMFCILTGNSSLEFIIFWGVASLVIVFVLSIDLAGSTPLLKSSLFEEKSLSIVIDIEKCKGSAFCIDVCPRNCFSVDKSGRTVSIIYCADRCVGCGACIIQCPFDAICFESAESDRINPTMLREFKLNILGKRSIKVNNC